MKTPLLIELVNLWRERALEIRNGIPGTFSIEDVAELVRKMAAEVEQVATELDDDWESQNKRAFIELLKHWLAEHMYKPDQGMLVLYSAFKLKKACIPFDLMPAVISFTAGVLNNAPPDWVRSIDAVGIAGY